MARLIPKRPLVLLILDGWGYREDTTQNAIALANTPIWDDLWATSPHTLLSGSGPDVGLPEGQMGNSEVGHMALGAGRVIYQDLTKISKAIADRTFFENPILKPLLQSVQPDQAIHLMGLFSPGGIHSHEDHFFAMLEMIKKTAKNSRVYIHAFLDGRDTPPKSAQNSLKKLQNWLSLNPIGQIASICGRFYAMDRDKRYERTQLAHEMLTQGKSAFSSHNALEGLNAAYARGETDEFVSPTLILDPNAKPIYIHNNDIVLFLNFRSDRARQLSYALTKTLLNPESHFLTMTEYAQDLKAKVLFPSKNISMGLGEVFQNANLTQLRLAETEKYAHVTFFFNGGLEAPYKGEDRLLIPSPQVRTYDEKPEMSAHELTDNLVDALQKQKYNIIICNYANADMIGHTGNLNAAIKAVETLDACLGRILIALKISNGEALITADHGNVECMQDNISHAPHTAHTTNLVPLVYVGKQAIALLTKTLDDSTPTLADVAPTLLDLMGIKQPKEMTGRSLITKRDSNFE